MGGKILNANDEVIFEFEDNEPIELLLSGYMTRAKFSEKYTSEILFSPWGNRLLKALHEAFLKTPTGKKLSEIDLAFSRAPKHYTDAGMTDMDWAHKEFFEKFTSFLSQNPSQLKRWEWKSISDSQKKEIIREGLYPNKISDTRLDDMIEDIKNNIQSYGTLI